MKATINPGDLILWHDEALLVVNKPAGLPTLVDGYHAEAPYLVGILKTIYQPLWTVHRLDKETSGIVVFGLTAEAHRELNTQFEKHQVEKIYHALVMGDPEWDDKTIDLPLRPNGDRKHRTIVDRQNGKPAITEVHVLERFGLATLVEAAPRTGRTHQIRAHLAAVGHPLVGDILYGGSQIYGLKRMGLHARALKLRHPITGEEMRFEAPYPEDFAEKIKQFRQPDA